MDSVDVRSCHTCHVVMCRISGLLLNKRIKSHDLWICFPGYYIGMSKALTKIPFILLATWGVHMTYTPPNPSPPQHERLPSSLAAPLENSGFIDWVPFIGRVSNYSEDIFAEIFNERPSVRSHNSFFALLRYQLSWHLQTLHRLYPN